MEPFSFTSTPAQDAYHSVGAADQDANHSLGVADWVTAKRPQASRQSGIHVQCQAAREERLRHVAVHIKKQGAVLPGNCATAGREFYTWCHAPQSPSDCGSSHVYRGTSYGLRVSPTAQLIYLPSRTY